MTPKEEKLLVIADQLEDLGAKEQAGSVRNLVNGGRSDFLPRRVGKLRGVDYQGSGGLVTSSGDRRAEIYLLENGDVELILSNDFATRAFVINKNIVNMYEYDK